MSRYGSGFREPPWVMGSPKEVMDWMEASNPKKKKDFAAEQEAARKHAKESQEELDKE